MELEAENQELSKRLEEALDGEAEQKDMAKKAEADKLEAENLYQMQSDEFSAAMEKATFFEERYQYLKEALEAKKTAKEMETEASGAKKAVKEMEAEASEAKRAASVSIEALHDQIADLQHARMVARRGGGEEPVSR